MFETKEWSVVVSSRSRTVKLMSEMASAPSN